MNPLNPHSSLNTSLSNHLLACEGTPSISLYEAITLTTFALSITSLNGNKKVSRSNLSDTLTGAQFVPDSGWPCAAKCFKVAIKCFLSLKVASPWKPLVADTPI